MAQLKSTSIIGNLSVTGKINTTNDIVAPNIPEFIIGSGTTDSSAKTSDWIGSSNQISEYRDGLTIKYKIGVVGQSTVTLNINGIGAKTVYRFNDTKLTTHFPVGSIITLVYHEDLNDGCWITNDYDANTNTYQRVYETSTDKEYAITARYNQTDGATYYAEYGRYTNGVTLNPSTNTITATGFKGALNVTDTTPTSATTYYLWYSTGKSGLQTARANADLYVYDTGTSSYLNVGSSSNNGMITLHHSKGGYVNIQTAEIGKDSSGNSIVRTLTIPNVTGTIITSAGGALTGTVTSSYSSSTWLNSVKEKSAFNLTGTGYVGWISGPGKDGRLAISSYPDHNNRLYFGYMSKTAMDAGTNALDYRMSWDGSSGTLFANKFAMSVGDTGKAAWQYNSATDCIELAWY